MKESIKQLARALQDDRIRPEQLAELEAHLAQSAEARELFLHEVNLYAGIEEIAVNEAVSEKNASIDRELSSPVRWLVLAGWPLAIASAVLAMAALFASRRNGETRSIATIVGLSGPLQWTGDGGRVDHELRVGMSLPGGTIEGMAPDSWFELQFEDGSTVMISGTSLLTIAELEQKELRLREGRFSANVVPQPDGKPMLIHTRSALLKVLGTQFDIEADLASTSLNVSEGKVRVQRLSDGREVDVPSQHRVIAAYDHLLEPERLPKTVNRWKSRLDQRPGGYGIWLPAAAGRAPSQKAIPMVPAEFPNITLYLVGISVSNQDRSPVVVQPGSQFVVRGRFSKPDEVHFGISGTRETGEFAGKFRGDLHQKQPATTPDAKGGFEVVYSVDDFSLDPCVRDRKDELAARPEGLILGAVWAFTYGDGPSGLEVTEVELVPPATRQ